MPEGRLEAVLWDVDGVIADTGIYHCRAWQEVFRKRGVGFTEEEFWRHFGQRNDTIIRDALGGGVSTEELDAIADEKEAIYRRLVAPHVRPLPGVVVLLRALRERSVRMAIASSGPLENIRLIIQGLGIEKYFSAIVFGREVTEGKPSPQVFLLAAEKLGVAPGNCVVVEDAVAGVTAAKSGGMKCLAVTNSHPRDRLKQADLIVDTLEAVRVSDLERLFGTAAGG